MTVTSGPMSHTPRMNVTFIWTGDDECAIHSGGPVEYGALFAQSGLEAGQA